MEQKNVHKAPETEFPFLFLVEATFTEQMLLMLMPLNIIQFYVRATQGEKRNFRSTFPTEVDLSRDVS